jgi:outer membrane lipoprotein SlyB
MHRIAFIAASLLAGTATAQVSSSAKPAPEHVRGDIVAIDGNTVTVKSRNGQTVKLQLADDVRVAVAEKGELADVRDGAFIGTTAVPQSDGTLRAIEVHVFPDSMRGTGEGHRPWDLRPGSTMTNATVTGMGAAGGKSPSTMTNATVSKVAGRKLTLKYKDGEKSVVVPPDAKVVKLEPSDRSQLKPGVHLFAIASRQAEGSLRAERLTIGKDGVVPPM